MAEIVKEKRTSILGYIKAFWNKLGEPDIADDDSNSSMDPELAESLKIISKRAAEQQAFSEAVVASASGLRDIQVGPNSGSTSNRGSKKEPTQKGEVPQKDREI